MGALRPIGHEDRLSLVEHLDELRSRMVTCAIAFFICFAFTYWQNDAILGLVNVPLEATQNLNCAEKSEDPLEQSACSQRRSGEAWDAARSAQAANATALGALAQEESLSDTTVRALQAAAAAAGGAAQAARIAAEATPTNRERQPVTLGVAEPFTTTFVVAGYAALLLALPLLLYQAYAFVLPAFTREEKKAVLPLMLMVPFLFIAGVTFAYFIALPQAVNFLQNFNDDNFDILVQARDYYKFSVTFMAVIGLLFQIPVGVLLVTRLGVVTTQQLRDNRGYVLVGLAIVAAIATPTPDPVTMLFALGPLVLLFEGSILLARFAERKNGPGRARWRWDGEDDDDEDDDDLWGGDERIHDSEPVRTHPADRDPTDDRLL